MFKPVQFGKYHLTERIAVGGMAEIFRATLHGVSGFEKPMVVKQILPQFAKNAEFIQMFIAEAKTAVGLTHGNIVPVYELGCIDNIYYIAMEYVHGKNLAEMAENAAIKKTPFPVELAVYVTIEICKGLSYAHRRTDERGRLRSVIHRDINPANIIVSFEGDVKIADFGIAKAHGNQNQTRAGVVKGTCGYMSPEQAMGETLDPRTDMFSLGIVLHELLTGRYLFNGANELETMEKVCTAPISPPSAQNPRVWPGLDLIVLKTLARRRNDRYADINELQLALSRLLYSQSHGDQATASSLADYVRRLFGRPLQIADSVTLDTRPEPQLPFVPTNVAQLDAGPTMKYPPSSQTPPTTSGELFEEDSKTKVFASQDPPPVTAPPVIASRRSQRRVPGDMSVMAMLSKLTGAHSAPEIPSTDEVDPIHNDIDTHTQSIPQYARQWRHILGWTAVVCVLLSVAAVVFYRKHDVSNPQLPIVPPSESQLSAEGPAPRQDPEKEVSAPAVKADIAIHTQPRQATVLWHLGESPTQLNLDQQQPTYLLRFEREGYRTTYHKLVADQLQHAANKQISVELQPTGNTDEETDSATIKISDWKQPNNQRGHAAAPAALSIAITSEPEGASIWLVVGQGAVTLHQRPAQRHYFKVVQAGYEPAFVSVLAEDFEPSPASPISRQVTLQRRENPMEPQLPAPSKPAPTSTSARKRSSKPARKNNNRDTQIRVVNVPVSTTNKRPKKSPKTSSDPMKTPTWAK